MQSKIEIPLLNLPRTHPTEDAIKSWGQSRTNYDADFWEFEYRNYRYLSGLDDRALEKRHNDIVKNLECLASPDRDVIPILSFLSSWYWYRKEHQTRLEMAMRGIAARLSSGHRPKVLVGTGPVRPKHPNAGDVLYRYGNFKWLEQLHKVGGLRMWHADFYARLEKDAARQDQEMVKGRFLNGPKTIITNLDGLRIPTIGDVRISHSGPEYFLLCMSCDWDVELFDDFGVDHCGVVEDVEGFALKLEEALAHAMPGYRFHHNPVEYYDPYEAVRDQYFSHAMSKDFKYAYQREYRFLALNTNSDVSGIECVDLQVGPLGSGFNIHTR
ncbi:hypothetical protein [Pseudomonas putida]|uniref:hypothetical protein n=1 Tax=Pseudomonas putida TaxID=303 RepID=UPI000AEC1327|nr:hypothetical protein [Pseudomonas putida]